ncbi:hypothetical protein ACTPOK_41405 [Streptomyces inhibens]|uniref:hypothetical protein n=1 Tax=Streptomyces inhibens TaxID=2293571 RepID=UPI00402ABBDD
MTRSQAVAEPDTAAGPSSNVRSVLAVFAVAAGSFHLVTKEFLPLGLLSTIHRDLNVSDAPPDGSPYAFVRHALCRNCQDS